MGQDLVPELRRQELAELLQLNKKSPVVCLYGLPGVGKTALLTGLKEVSAESGELPIVVPLNYSNLPENTSESLYTSINISLREQLPKDSQTLPEPSPLNLSPLLRLTETLASVRTGLNKKVLVIIDAVPENPIFTAEAVLAELHTLAEASDNISFIFSGNFIPHPPPDYASKAFQTLSKNTLYLRPFNNYDHQTYLSLLLQGKNFTVTKFQALDAYYLCGGHPLLTKIFFEVASVNASRLGWENFKMESVSFPEIQTFLKKLWGSLEDVERQLLLRVELFNPKDSLVTYEHLEKKGVFRKSNGRYSLFSKLLESYIKKYASTRVLPDGIYLDGKSEQVFIDGREITAALTQSEYQLLEYLCNTDGRVVKREELLNKFKNSKGLTNFSDEALDQLVVRLRGKIEADRHNPRHLLTLRGRGFQFRP